MPVEILIRSAVKKEAVRLFPRPRLRRVVVALQRELGCVAAEIGIVITDDVEMRALNAKYRGKEATTDVLSFPLGDPWQAALGDIVISLPVAKRQARKFSVTTRQEILRLLIHGLLHLLGYEHEKVPSAKARAMRRKEEKLFRELVGMV